MLDRLLACPETKRLDLDNPEVTAIRREVIRNRPFLRKIYEEWYGLIAERVPPLPGAIVELGSGPGFLREYVPDLITSDVSTVEGIDQIIDGRQLPFADSSLRAIVMTDALHHLPRVERFFSEAQRTLRRGGRIVAIEPWYTPWSGLIYRTFHHEPFITDATEWAFPELGPLSGANGALPWIVTVRDHSRFEALYPSLRITEIVPFMPFRYLVSGGVSRRSLQPGWMHRAWAALENRTGLAERAAMFAVITIDRT